MIREEKDRFDLVISDVHLPDMDGFKLLELVGLESDLPVIMLSVNSDPKLVMKAVSHGACDYLVKPIRIEELRNIWQHVIRRKKVDSRNRNGSSDQVKSHRGGEGFVSPLGGNKDQNGKFNRKRKDDENEIEDNGNEYEDPGPRIGVYCSSLFWHFLCLCFSIKFPTFSDKKREYEDPGTQKKPRVVWSIELHRKFVSAVNQLGIEKAVPKRILDMMNVEGLTRENVASHLQKYRLYLKRISTAASQQANNGMLSRLNISGTVNLRNLTPPTLVQPSQAQNSNNSIGGGFGNQSVHNVASFTLESFNNGVSVSSNLLDPGKCNVNWHNSVETSKMHPNPLISVEPFNSQLPVNVSRESNPIDLTSAMDLPPFEDSREMQSRSWAEQRHNLDESSAILNQNMDAYPAESRW